LSSLKIISQLLENDDLFLYLEVTDLVVSSILVREDEGIQWLVFYSSRTLNDEETKYLKLEKQVLALVSTSRKLKSYFQTYQVTILTKQSLRQILHKLELFGCLVKSAIELREFGLQYKPYLTIKGQALANVIVKCCFTEHIDTPDHPTSTIELSAE